LHWKLPGILTFISPGTNMLLSIKRRLKVADPKNPHN